MRFITVMFLMSLFFWPAVGQAEEYVTARLFSPVTASGTDKTIAVGLQLKMAPGWKTYWRTPGDAGLGPVFDWTGSDNLSSMSVAWPAPKRFRSFDLDNFVYEDEVIFPLAAELEKAGQPVFLQLRLDLLVCSTICVPEAKNLSLTLPAGTATPAADSRIFDRALKNIPAKNAAGDHFLSAHLEYDPGNENYLVVNGILPAAPGKTADLFIENDAGLVFGKPDISYSGKTGEVIFKAPVHSKATLAGIEKKLANAPAVVTYVDGAVAMEENIIVTPGQWPGFFEAKQGVGVGLLLIALLGGLILNLMPCVLPVLSLKVLSVIGHGGKDGRAVIFRNFMASAAGIIFSFWLMALILTALKAAGTVIGWGIQFQHPAFLVFLIVVVLLFAANLWGLFDIPLPRFIARNIPAKHEHNPTLLGHFMTGAFATLLATPCTAPFLGTAVSFALSGSAIDLFIIFTFLGIGLALPYIVLALSPRLFKFMPRPGAWMIRMKKILALALVLTALWLANVLAAVVSTPTLDEGWEPFDQQAIARLVAEDKTVFIDITADWCLTCKANKRIVLDDDEIEKILSADNIVKMQADWTHRDESISRYLQNFGRYGIPFNAVFGPGAPEGLVLPELLSKTAIKSAIAEAAGE